MSYANPRPAKLKKDVDTKLITAKGVSPSNQKAGVKCSVQRNPNDIGWYNLYFGKRSSTSAEVAKIPAEQLTDFIEYTDKKPEGFNF